jgi:hypothetical protein
MDVSVVSRENEDVFAILDDDAAVLAHSAHAQLWAWADLCKIEPRNSEAIWLATCSGDILPKACGFVINSYPLLSLLADFDWQFMQGISHFPFPKLQSEPKLNSLFLHMRKYKSRMMHT